MSGRQGVEDKLDRCGANGETHKARQLRSTRRLREAVVQEHGCDIGHARCDRHAWIFINSQNANFHVVKNIKINDLANWLK